MKVELTEEQVKWFTDSIREMYEADAEYQPEGDAIARAIANELEYVITEANRAEQERRD